MQHPVISLTPLVENVMKYKLQSQMVVLEDCFSEINSRAEVVRHYCKKCLNKEHPDAEELWQHLDRIFKLAEKGNLILNGECDEF